jgi:hypothetical protein
MKPAWGAGEEAEEDRGQRCAAAAAAAAAARRAGRAAVRASARQREKGSIEGSIEGSKQRRALANATTRDREKKHLCFFS